MFFGLMNELTRMPRPSLRHLELLEEIYAETAAYLGDLEAARGGYRKTDRSDPKTGAFKSIRDRSGRDAINVGAGDSAGWPSARPRTFILVWVRQLFSTQPQIATRLEREPCESKAFRHHDAISAICFPVCVANTCAIPTGVVRMRRPSGAKSCRNRTCHDIACLVVVVSIRRAICWIRTGKTPRTEL
jgi:hypothetical protein